eukprot:7473289-Pyramimonas_sp.AAC.1
MLETTLGHIGDYTVSVRPGDKPSISATTLGHIGDYTVSVRRGDNLASQRLHLVILETTR